MTYGFSIPFLFVPAVAVGSPHEVLPSPSFLPSTITVVLPRVPRSVAVICRIMEICHAARFAHGVVQMAQRSGAFERRPSINSTHIPHGHPGIFHCLSPNPIFTICIFIPLSPTLAKKPEKAADGRIFQIVVPQHIAPAGHLQTAVPWGKLAFRIRNREICSHILDFRRPEPRFGDHLYRRAVGGIKHQHPAGESICHPLHQRLDLLGQEVIEHPGGKNTAPPEASILSNHAGSFRSQGMFCSRSPAGSSCCRKAITSGKSRL